jgi:hypothetical protein
VHDGRTFIPALVAETASHHSHHSGMVTKQAVLIRVFVFGAVTLRADLLPGRPGTALIRPDANDVSRLNGWTRLFS